LQDCTALLWVWQEPQHGDAYILNIVVHMTKKTCGDVCKYMIHIVVKGIGHWNSESTGTCLPTGLNTAVGKQGQQAQEQL